MTAGITDKLRKYKSLFSTTLSTSIGTGTSDTITPASVTGLPTDTAITLTFDRVDSGGVATPTKLERIRGIISGGNFTAYVRGKDGTTEQAHTAGAVIEMIWNADDLNDMVDWANTQHNQDGTHGAITSTNASMVTASMVTPTINAGKFITSINDANGNEVIKTPATTSAVNEVTVTNSATGNSPSVSATGGDDNLDLLLVSKGTGVVKANGVAISTGTVPVKASGAEITTGTDDAKFATAKALADATVGKLGAAWVAHSATIGGFSGTPTQVIRYMQIGKIVAINYNITGTSNATSLTMTLPTTSADNGLETYGAARGVDNSSNVTTPVEAYLPANSNTVQFFKDWGGTGWTGSNSKSVKGVLIYETA